MSEELTDAQLTRQDIVDNAIFAMVRDLLPEEAKKKLEWDIELVGGVVDVIIEYLEKKGICTEMEFYPYFVEE
jgi:hypothetical protein